MVSFFDQADDRVTGAPDMVPARSWKMNEETKRGITFGHITGDQATHATEKSGFFLFFF